jgi:hypothetical protein
VNKFVISPYIENFSFTEPNYDRMETYYTDDEQSIATLKEKYKIEIVGKASNIVHVDPNFKTTASVRLIMRGTGNKVYIGKPIGETSQLHLHAEFHRNNSTLVVSDLHNWPVRLSLISYHDNQTIIWGKGATTNGTSMTVQFPESIVAVGDDCMFATDTWMRNSDMHGLYDLATGKKINNPGNIILQPHVWVGQYAYLLGDVLVGYGTTIGAQSLVKGILEPCSVYAGSPAKKLRENTTWNREPEAELPQQTIDLINECKLKFSYPNKHNF